MKKIITILLTFILIFCMITVSAGKKEATPTDLDSHITVTKQL